jgi:hypothetical protein
VTQCEHCRELRKTKQVHVKCKCGDARSGKGDSGSASKKTHDPAFPSGVPEHLTAIVTLISEHGSDSEHAANPKAGPCPCNPGGKCTCATARKSKRSTGPEPPLDPSTAVKPSAGHEYRRVLPKPQITPPAPLIRPGPVHSPSSTGNGKQSQRPRVHPDPLYSPYERAYDANHSQQTSSDHSESELSPMEVGSSYTSRPPGNQDSFGWSDYPALSQRSLCGCGNSCPCPGCFEHRGPSALQAYQGTSSSPCTNPRYCTSCVECAVVLGHPNQQPAVPGSFDTRATSFMDEWLRQLVEGMPTLPADGDTLHPATPMPSRSTQSPPGPPDCCVEAAGVREQSAFAVRSVSVGVRGHGGRKETLRVCPSALQVRFLLSDWAVGTYQLAISLGSSPNTEFPPTGPPRGRRCLGLTKQETLSGVYNHAF